MIGDRERAPFGSWPARPFRERSQVALEIGLHLYAVLTTLVILRIIFRLLRIDHRLWTGATVYRFTDPFVDVLELLPGSEYHLLGDVTLPDLTLAALVALVPIGILARAGLHRNL